MRIPSAKIAASWDHARAQRQSIAGKVVFTNGVFDLLHSGHIDVLTAARSYGDALIVGLNSDASVKRLKGPDRPIRNQAERAHVLAALEAVDLVVIFDDDTPLELVLALRPDVIVKGGDYALDSVVGGREVQSWGGEAIVVRLTPGQSTSSIIERLSGR